MRLAVILLLVFATETASSPKPPPFKVATPPKPDCGFAKHVEQGDNFTTQGHWAGALVSYEKALRCKDDPALYMKVILTACRSSRNLAKAKLYLAKLPETKREAASQLVYYTCVRRGPKPWEEPRD